ncbi:hypothetical protein, partial [Burkholderia sp. SIMBA_019]|uniref:hypothetical protein n=1 Tax=Burkholderia sp. SIMBA_019 TaxID=3085765 RepID=UPI00397BA627
DAPVLLERDPFEARRALPAAAPLRMQPWTGGMAAGRDAGQGNGPRGNGQAGAGQAGYAGLAAGTDPNGNAGRSPDKFES